MANYAGPLKTPPGQDAKTLKDVLPREFMGVEYDPAPARQHADVRVVAEHDARQEPWPGTEKNVNYWWELEDGYAVGWNENLSRGWSFPIRRFKNQ